MIEQAIKYNQKIATVSSKSLEDDIGSSVILSKDFLNSILTKTIKTNNANSAHRLEPQWLLIICHLPRSSVQFVIDSIHTTNLSLFLFVDFWPLILIKTMILFHFGKLQNSQYRYPEPIRNDRSDPYYMLMVITLDSVPLWKVTEFIDR